MGRGLGTQGDDFALPRTVVDERMVRDQLRCLGRGVYAVGAVGGVAPGAHPGPRPPVPDLPPYAQAVRGIGALEPRAIVGGIVEAARGGQPDPRLVAHERVDVSVGVVGKPRGRPSAAVGVVGCHLYLHEQLGHAPDGGIAAHREPHLAVAGVAPAPVVAEVRPGVRRAAGISPAAAAHATPGQARRQQQRQRRSAAQPQKRAPRDAAPPRPPTRRPPGCAAPAPDGAAPASASGRAVPVAASRGPPPPKPRRFPVAHPWQSPFSLQRIVQELQQVDHRRHDDERDGGR